MDSNGSVAFVFCSGSLVLTPTIDTLSGLGVVGSAYVQDKRAQRVQPGSKLGFALLAL